MTSEKGMDASSIGRLEAEIGGFSIGSTRTGVRTGCRARSGASNLLAPCGDPRLRRPAAGASRPPGRGRRSSARRPRRPGARACPARRGCGAPGPPAAASSGVTSGLVDEVGHQRPSAQGGERGSGRPGVDVAVHADRRGVDHAGRRPPGRDQVGGRGRPGRRRRPARRPRRPCRRCGSPPRPRPRRPRPGPARRPGPRPRRRAPRSADRPASNPASARSEARKPAPSVLWPTSRSPSRTTQFTAPSRSACGAELVDQLGHVGLVGHGDRQPLDAERPHGVEGRRPLRRPATSKARYTQSSPARRERRVEDGRRARVADRDRRSRAASRVAPRSQGRRLIRRAGPAAGPSSWPAGSRCSRR